MAQGVYKGQAACLGYLGNVGICEARLVRDLIVGFPARCLEAGRQGDVVGVSILTIFYISYEGNELENPPLDQNTD